MDSWLLILLVFLIFFGIYVVGVLLPKSTNKNTKGLAVAIQGLIDEYFMATTDVDLEKRHLRFHRLAVSADRVLGKALEYYGCVDRSVNQQIRVALQKNVISYDQFQVLKRFHHMRNEVVHEDLVVSGDNEGVVYSALLVMKSLMGA